MQTQHEPQHEPQHVLQETYEQLLRTPTTTDRSADVYGAIGLLLMLLIATGTVPLYDWQT